MKIWQFLPGTCIKRFDKYICFSMIPSDLISQYFMITLKNSFPIATGVIEKDEVILKDISRFLYRPCFFLQWLTLFICECLCWGRSSLCILNFIVLMYQTETTINLI
jgi:hypothetical protein